jgi:hypothetical protein
LALDWLVNRPISAMRFIDIETIVGCADQTSWGMYGLENIAAFEDLPFTGEKRIEDHRTPPTMAPGTPEQESAEESTAAAASTEVMPTVPVESELMEMLGAHSKNKATDGITLISLGCFCGPKLSFQKIGRGAETLPFDWIRVSFDGLLHFIQTDFEGYFDYVTKKQVPNSHMVMYRSALHSFWHDNPDAPEMREKYERRIKRFSGFHNSPTPLLFVRAISSPSELERAEELLSTLRDKFGELACLLLIADFQKTALGPIMVDDCEDLLVYFLGKEERGPVGEMAPYSKPVELAIKWLNGEVLQSGCVATFTELGALADGPPQDLADFGACDGCAFEPCSAAETVARREKLRASLTRPKKRLSGSSAVCCQGGLLKLFKGRKQKKEE